MTDYNFYFPDDDGETVIQITVPSNDCDRKQAARAAEMVAKAIVRKYGIKSCPSDFDVRRIAASTLTCKCKRNKVE